MRRGDLFVLSWESLRFQIGAGLYAVGRPVQKRNDEDGQIDTIQSLPLERGALFNRFFFMLLLLLLLSTPLHQRAASRVQHPKSCGSQQSLPPGGKERLHFVGIRPEVQARKGGW